MKKKLIVVGNWKMYIDTPESAKKLATALKRASTSFGGVDVAVAPAFPFIPAVARVLKDSAVRVAAQTVSPSIDAKHTGDVSAYMLKSVGCSVVIVGHSERRATGETDAMVRAQIIHTLDGGLSVVVCVGEVVRDAAGKHFSVIATQIAVLKDITPKKMSKVVIAYEPAWAIGKTAVDAMTAEDLHETIIFIRKTLVDIFGRTVALNVPILYGGSVEPGNATHLVEQGGVSGFLVGHASTDFDSFKAIIKTCVQ